MSVYVNSLFSEKEILPRDLFSDVYINMEYKCYGHLLGTVYMPRRMLDGFSVSHGTRKREQRTRSGHRTMTCVRRNTRDHNLDEEDLLASNVRRSGERMR